MNLLKLPDFFIQQRCVNLSLTSTDIDDLKVFPFFTQSILEGLKAELPLYLLKADGVSTEMIKLEKWFPLQGERGRSS